MAGWECSGNEVMVNAEFTALAAERQQENALNPMVLNCPFRWRRIH